MSFPEQPGLFDQPASGDTLELRFNAFHAAHPEVYRELCRLARIAKAKGKKRIGIGLLFEVMRWQRIIESLPGEAEDFKLNNNYRSRYARLIMRREPDLNGIFEVREMKT